MWIYSGYYNNEADKLDPMKQPTARRSKEDPSGMGLFSGWSFAWLPTAACSTTALPAI